MNVHRFLTALLLRCYPAAWRREYGEELEDILAARPLTAAITIDVVGSGLRQRFRAAKPSTILGGLSMLFVLGQLLLPYDGWGQYLPAAVRPSGMTFPTVKVTLLASEIYVYVGIACGYWTASRIPGAVSRGGWAAMRMAQIASWPVTIAGTLLAFGAVDSRVAAMAGRVFQPSPIEMVLAPLAALPLFWIWGCGGAWLKDWANRRRDSRQQRAT